MSTGRRAATEDAVAPPGDAAAEETAWWREGVIYQVYPRSFADSNGDGVGDLRGILAHLDHLNDGTPRSLGVDAIWLSPIYPSPMADFGYDVADYCDIAPLFGDLETFDRLVAACHERGVRVVLDFVLNHTSDQHAWFIESRSSRDAPRRGWYHWRDPAPGGGPPNGWTAVFGGSAWAWDARSGQYYLHSFLPQQPDLNWEHPAVVAAMSDVLRFWMARGVDGFRLDAVQQLAKPPNDAAHAAVSLIGDGRIDAQVVSHLRAIRRVLDERPGTVGIAEAYVPPDQVATLYGGAALDAVQLAFHFELIRLTAYGPYTPWHAAEIGALLAHAQAALPAGALPSYALANHDVPRFRSRHDADGRGLARARAAALLLLGLPGAPCLYYGEEIGMQDVPVPPALRHDPAGRDAARTPMQWDRTDGRGFTRGAPWLSFGPRDIEVASQRDDEHSLLALYRRAIWARKREPALRRGDLAIVRASDALLVVRRQAPGGRPVLLVLNTAIEAQRFPLAAEFAHVLLASDDSTRIEPLRMARELLLPGLAAAWLVP